MKFDPMNPENWRDTLPVLRSFGVWLFSLFSRANLSSQGAQLLAKYMDIYKMLQDTFPEMKIERQGLCYTFFFIGCRCGTPDLLCHV